ncbi:MAG: NUDIX domain-containing protein [Chitinophagaceae bacterium]|nr:NUDIX domain-containing protein [Chitinophagaceae bacterium]
MHKTIYFEHKPLFLCDAMTQKIEEYTHHQETILIDELNVHTVKAMIHEMQQPNINAGVFIYPNVDELLSAIKKRFTVVLAAGGLVHSVDEHILLIFRKGKWDLPKGKLDKKERFESCALREVQEETGLQNLTLQQALTVTYHTYRENNVYMLKETHWFLMYSEVLQAPTPQVEEDIEKCEWVKIRDRDKYTLNTHASIVEVLSEAVKILSATKQ